MDSQIQSKLDSSVPMVGMSIAAASAACTLAMIADAAAAIGSRKFWIPCKYFRLNAFWLTFLAVTVKLPFDFTIILNGIDDKLARLSSLLLMTTAMGNFATSLGAMDDNGIRMNVSALCVLVVTVAGSQLIRLIEIRQFWWKLYLVREQMTATVFMLPLLAALCSLAVMVPAARRSIDSKYHEMHKRIILGKLGRSELKMAVMKYWVMAETGSLQFVIARSVTSVAAGVVCLLMASILFEADIRLHSVYKTVKETASEYKVSTVWILHTQRLGVTLGAIAPLLRLFMTARFKCTAVTCKSLGDEFKIEDHWTKILVEWRESPLPLQIRHQKIRRAVQDAKGAVLNFFIAVQILIVYVSKLLLLVIAALLKISVACLHRIKRFTPQESVEGSETKDLKQFVLLLEGEAELPESTLNGLIEEIDRLIAFGKMNTKCNFIRLLKNSVSFNGVREFDSKEIRSLNFQEPPNCWSLPVVTLAAIALSVNNKTCESDQLLSAMNEGFSILKLVDEGLDENGALSSIQNAADVVWSRIELYGKWLHKDIRGTKNRSVQTCHQKVQELSEAARKILMDFNNNADNFVVQNPTNWPANIIAANSMYRITQTLLLQGNFMACETDEQLFHSLSVMISDIMAACLVNLERVVLLKCHSNNIKDRVGNVREAAVLLGESEEILDVVFEQHVLPRLEVDQVAKIDEWRDYMEFDLETI